MRHAPTDRNPVKVIRDQKITRLLQRHLTDILMFRMRDPRLQHVQINRIHLSPDRSQAKIFVTFLGEGAHSDALMAQTFEVLHQATGAIRSLLARQADLRRTPHLRFCLEPHGTPVLHSGG